MSYETTYADLYKKVDKANPIVTGIIQAVIIAAISVFGNEIVKQLLVKRVDDNK